MAIKKHISEINITVVCVDDKSEEIRTEEVSWFETEDGGISQERIQDALSFIMNFVEMRLSNKSSME